MVTHYTIHAGDTGTDLGRVGKATTILGAKRAGRKAVREMLPNGCGNYRVRDEAGRTVYGGERSIRTDYEWFEG